MTNTNPEFEQTVLDWAKANNFVSCDRKWRPSISLDGARMLGEAMSSVSPNSSVKECTQFFMESFECPTYTRDILLPNGNLNCQFYPEKRGVVILTQEDLNWFLKAEQPYFFSVTGDFGDRLENWKNPNLRKEEGWESEVSATFNVYSSHPTYLEMYSGMTDYGTRQAKQKSFGALKSLDSYFYGWLKQELKSLNPQERLRKVLDTFKLMTEAVEERKWKE